jgi:hypothetical protein
MPVEQKAVPPPNEIKPEASSSKPLPEEPKVEEEEKVAITPTTQTPLMTHDATVMGQAQTVTPEIVRAEAPKFDQPKPPPLPPIEALNAQPVDLTLNNEVNAPLVDRPIQQQDDYDFGSGSNLEFSDITPPPPVPPPIVKK